MGLSLMKKKTKRIPEIELMKAIAIIGMVFVHVYEMADCYDTYTSGAGYYIGIIIELFGSVFSAPVFMFAMGWGAVFSEKSSAKIYLDRFIQLSLLGLLVNVFTQWMPMLIYPEKNGVFKQGWYRIFAVDIYPFAAFAMLYLALMKKVYKSETKMIGLSGILLTLSLLINGLVAPESYSSGYDFSDTILGLFVRENDWSYFPFVSWIAFPTIGFLIGLLYKKWDSKKLFFTVLTVTGIISVTVSSLLMKQLDIPNAALMPYFVEDVDYYAMHSLNVLCCCGVVFLEFALCSFFMKLTKKKLCRSIQQLSRNVMHIYIVQWMIIGCLCKVIGGFTTILPVLLTAALTLVAACFIAIVRLKIIMRSAKRKKLRKHLLE